MDSSYGQMEEDTGEVYGCVLEITNAEKTVHLSEVVPAVWSGTCGPRMTHEGLRVNGSVSLMDGCSLDVLNNRFLLLRSLLDSDLSDSHPAENGSDSVIRRLLLPFQRGKESGMKRVDAALKVSGMEGLQKESEESSSTWKEYRV